MLLPERVRRKLQESFFDAGVRGEAVIALRSYVAECPQESERVALAIVKLSEGDLDTLVATVAAARLDYRDVLAWAEYPEEMALGINPDARCLRDARARDRAQYLSWLGD